MKYTSFTYNIAIVLFVFLSSCEDFVQIDPPNSQIASITVFEDDKTAIAASAGMYNTMVQTGSFIGHSFYPISYLGGLSSDELIDYTGSVPYSEFFTNELSIENSTVLGVWTGGYRTIYEANAIIEGVATSKLLSEKVRRQLEGEARFVRAFCHFYLVNLFGDVPLVTSTDYRTNSLIGRTKASDIYVFLINELQEVERLLLLEYSDGTRTRPNKLAATALLARVYLYNKNYALAEACATSVINNPTYQLLDDPNDVFLANSSESILQLAQLYPFSFPTGDALNLLITNDFPTKSLRPQFVSLFDPNDIRGQKWINTRAVPSGDIYYYPYKYKVRSYSVDANYPEFLVLLRLAEQYLIRAESRMMQGDIEGSKNDLNVIRRRAGLANSDADDEASLKLAIEQERSLELFCEMGHRWLDLKRTNRADDVLTSLKPSWNSTDIYYPIPEREILTNPKLVPQNTGY